MLNKQKPEKTVEGREDGAVEVVQIWPTIQGEGPFAGCTAYFIRLAGCNLQCPHCDTDYTSKRYLMDPQAILYQLDSPKFKSDLVVISGGEPFRQELGILIIELTSHGFHVQIETNGTIYDDSFPYEVVQEDLTIVCSPKGGRVRKGLEDHLHCYKYVLQAGKVNSVDGLPLSTMGLKGSVARPSQEWKDANGPDSIYVQPLDEQDQSKNELNNQACVKSAMMFGYRVSLQTHKYLGVE